MRKNQLGDSQLQEQALRQQQLQHLHLLALGRVLAEHRERYIVGTEGSEGPAGEWEAEVSGTLRHRAHGREDFPVVGDWVALALREEGVSIIQAILPRTSTLTRQAVGQAGEHQLIAANVDCALVMQAVDRDFNLNRLERYLTLCHAGGVQPLVVLTKADLLEEGALMQLQAEAQQRLPGTMILTLSNRSEAGQARLRQMLEPGKSYCMLGSSGVGKSTLLNVLCGADAMRTDSLSLSTGKGRHVTTHRELVVLPNGSLLIDTPGMREIGVTEASGAIDNAFAQIALLAEGCRYRDCYHLHQQGCAVKQAVSEGGLAAEAYGNFVQLRREQEHFESSHLERRREDKRFGRMLKNYHKHH